MKQKNDMKIFLVITTLHYLAANFAHPFTPTLIKNLGLNDYMFGIMFASMAFTNFLFSPFWGKLRDYFEPRKLLAIGCFGYALGQIFFSIAATEVTIVFARCFSGIFTGAVNVSTLVYVTDTSEEGHIGKNLAKLAILNSLGAAFGYLIGGVMGTVSITLTFMLQSGTLVLCGILYLCLLKKDKGGEREKISVRIIGREANPLMAFINCRFFMTKKFVILFIAVLFANLGTNAFDQCFNYYLKDQFQLSSAYNGVIRAATGIITLIANSTICMWIMKKSKIKRPTAAVLLCCAVSIASMLFVEKLPMFIAVCIVFFAFNAIYIPLLQDCVVRETDKDGNLVMGFYNAVKSMGMIGGALVAGGIYGIGEKLPFVFAAICFTLAAVLLGVRWIKTGSAAGKINKAEPVK